MTRRFADFLIIRQVPTAGEAIAGWSLPLFALLLAVLVATRAAWII